MTTVFRNYSILISVVLLLAVLIYAWLFPSAGSILGIMILLFSITMAILSILSKYRNLYRQGEITRSIFLRNVLLEIFGILLAMTLAGLLGRHIAQIAIEHISNDLTKLIASIVIGLLAGVGVGILVKRAWGRLLKA